MIKSFLAAALITLSPNLAHAVVYSCPDIPTGKYYSDASEVSNWYVYAVDKMHKPLNQFAVTSRPVWDDFTVETTEDNKVSILFCSSISSNGYINTMKFVDEPNCKINKNQRSFTCH